MCAWLKCIQCKPRIQKFKKFGVNECIYSVRGRHFYRIASFRDHNIGRQEIEDSRVNARATVNHYIACAKYNSVVTARSKNLVVASTSRNNVVKIVGSDSFVSLRSVEAQLIDREEGGECAVAGGEAEFVLPRCNYAFDQSRRCPVIKK